MAITNPAYDPQKKPRQEIDLAKRIKKPGLVLGDTAPYEVRPQIVTGPLGREQPRQKPPSIDPLAGMTPDQLRPARTGQTAQTGQVALANYQAGVQGSAAAPQNHRAALEMTTTDPAMRRLRHELDQKQLIQQKQVARPLADPQATAERQAAWDNTAANLRGLLGDVKLGESSLRKAPAVRSPEDYAQRARDFDEYTIKALAAQTAPQQAKLAAGESLTPDESSYLQHADMSVEELRNRLMKMPKIIEGPDGRITEDYSHLDDQSDYYKQRGQDIAAGQGRSNVRFKEARAREAAEYAKRSGERDTIEARVRDLDAARYETALATEKARGSEPARQARYQDAQIGLAEAQAQNDIYRAQRESRDLQDARSPEEIERRRIRFGSILEDQGVNPATFDQIVGNDLEQVFSALDGDNDFRGARGFAEDPADYVRSAKSVEQIATALARAAEEDPVSARQKAIPILDEIRARLGSDSQFETALFMNRLGNFGANELDQIAQSMNTSMRILDRVVSK